MSAVNAAEVLQKLTEKGMSHKKAGEYAAAIRARNCGFRLPSGRIGCGDGPKNVAVGLSFANRACLALGSLRGVPVMTGSELGKVDLGIHIQVIRPTTKRSKGRRIATQHDVLMEWVSLLHLFESLF